MIFQEDLKNKVESMQLSVMTGKSQIKLITEGTPEERASALRELELTSAHLRRLVEEFKQRSKDLMVDISGAEKIYRPDYEVIVECIAPDKTSKKREVINKNGIFFAQLEPFKIVRGRVTEVTIKNDHLPPEALRSLHNFQELRKLSVVQSSIPSLSSLIGHKSIQHLSIANPTIKMDISAAGTLPKLQSVEIFGARITTPELLPLFSSTSIEELHLGANSLTVLDGIEQMTQLKRLILSRNPLRSILPLSKLPHLEEVSLDVRDGLDISPLLNCPALHQVNLTYVSEKGGGFGSWFSKRPGGRIVNDLTARGVVVNTRSSQRT